MTKAKSEKPSPQKKAKAGASAPVSAAVSAAPPAVGPPVVPVSVPPRKRPASSRRAASTSPRQAKPTLDVGVHQIFFEPGQRTQLDPAFLPLDNQGATDPLLEFAVLQRLAQDPKVRQAALWGAVSWRFREKTGLPGQAYLDEVRANPGFDVYFCNPYPENEGLYSSPWQQAFAKHPGFRLLAAQVLAAAGHDPAVMEDVVPSTRFSACNFFVGNEKFWDSYIPFVREVVDKARRTLPAAVLEGLDSHRADPHGLHPGATYWPFIIERLFTVYLQKHQADVKPFKIKLKDPESKLSVHVKRLREMKDVAHHTKSQWLCSCWLQYRNLFLLQAAGKEWCRLHLSDVTPKQIRFG